jgi:hypothetical protein
MQVLSNWKKSKFQLIKMHDILHYKFAICRSGSPFESSSNMYKHLHIVLMKIAYWTSNRRTNDYVDYIVKHNKRLLRANADINKRYAQPTKNPKRTKWMQRKGHPTHLEQVC